MCLFVGYSCTDRFMDYELLQNKANQICVNNFCEGVLTGHHMEEKMWLMPSQNFSCSGNITAFVLGGELIPNKKNFPIISLWSTNLDSNNNTYYEKVPGSERVLEIDPYSFSVSGPLYYHLPEPLHHTDGNILGLKSYDVTGSVRLYYINNDLSQIYEIHSENTHINLSDHPYPLNRMVLLLPISSIIIL